MSSKEMTWKIRGMHCVHCEQAVVRAVSSLSGLEQPRADYRSSTLTALWDSERLPLANLRQALQAEGYDIQSGGWLRELLSLLAALALCAALYGLFSISGLAAFFSRFPLAREGMSLGAVFVVGLMTSVHCVAMCGGINLSQSSHAAQRGQGVMRSNLLYNLGRVLSYTALGCLIGALGAIFKPNRFLQAAIQALAALFMIIMALNLTGAFTLLQRFSIHLPRGLFHRAAKKSRASLFIGLANGLMPCGPLQAMQLFALSQGSWIMGGLSMLCFSLGTVPLMLGFGLLSGRLNQRFARGMQWISALLVLVMGMSMLSNGLGLAGVATLQDTAQDACAVVSPDASCQSIATELDWGTYPSFTVRAGIPVVWTLHAEEEKLIGCNNELLIPAFNLDVRLHPGDNVISFTPEEVGTIPYSCWMGMIRAVITVVP